MCICFCVHLDRTKYVGTKKYFNHSTCPVLRFTKVRKCPQECHTAVFVLVLPWMCFKRSLNTLFSFVIHVVESCRSSVVSTSSLTLSCTLELHLSGFNGTASHPDMQKIRKIRFFFKNRLHWQFEMENNFYKRLFRLHIYLFTNKTLIHNSLYVFDNWGNNLNHKKV